MQQLSLSSYAVYVISVNEALIGKWDQVGVEHLFLALCKVTNFDRNDSKMILDHMGKGRGNADEIQKDFESLKAALDSMKIDPNKSR